ncbi:hypothetical protein TPAR_06894 [Tolypocladium paradoxum]|uniref:Uncharacterized protein n=1 Tax=Tolypocladium paradoxum TaxID=94208 RepID=A0A2S4KRS2_9HYPO|nr:hypothetical protein TPAR_06894 [Tolypocladium paradoxum]
MELLLVLASLGATGHARNRDGNSREPSAACACGVPAPDQSDSVGEATRAAAKHGKAEKASSGRMATPPKYQLQGELCDAPFHPKHLCQTGRAACVVGDNSNGPAGARAAWAPGRRRFKHVSLVPIQDTRHCHGEHKVASVSLLPRRHLVTVVVVIVGVAAWASQVLHAIPSAVLERLVDGTAVLMQPSVHPSRELPITSLWHPCSGPDTRIDVRLLPTRR